jgi:type I restriction enzyme S subunit
MEMREGYKLADIGAIPIDWETYSVRELIELLTDYDANGSFSSVAENVKSYDYEEYAWYVRSTDLENNSSLDRVKYVDEKSYKF